MASPPRFSVIVPFHDAQRFIGAAVRSVIDQTWADWELLAIDDGSTDGSGHTVRMLARTDPRIRVLQHPDGHNRGVAASRNLGVHHARGELLAFLDADDVWLGHHLDVHQQAAARDRDSALFYSRVRNIDDAGAPSAPTPLHPNPVWGHGPVSATLLATPLLAASVWPATSAISVRAEAFRRVGFPEDLQSQVEDFVAWVRLTARQPAVHIPSITCSYRVHPVSWTGQTPPWRLELARDEGLTRLLDLEPSLQSAIHRAQQLAWVSAMASGAPDDVIALWARRIPRLRSADLPWLVGAGLRAWRRRRKFAGARGQA